MCMSGRLAAAVAGRLQASRSYPIPTFNKLVLCSFRRNTVSRIKYPINALRIGTVCISYLSRAADNSHKGSLKAQSCSASFST